MTIREREPLAPRTTFGVGGPARFFVEVTTREDLVLALDKATSLGVPAFVLGGGSNLLVADRGMDALVIRLALAGIESEHHGESVRYTVAAGERWDAVVERAVNEGLAGVECLSGIPGDVGATPIQNVGAYGQDVSETIERVDVLDRRSHEPSSLDGAACGFAYRDSIFKGEARGRWIVTSVTFRLRPGAEPTVRYAELERALGSERRSVSLVRETILRLRRGKGMVLDADDADTRSAGSFFTNPIVPDEDVALVIERARGLGKLGPNETMPSWPAEAGRTKLSAAWLIERAGFPKGTVRGRAGTSTKHSLALVNRGGATASEIVALAREIQDGVGARLGVRITPEPELVGFEAGELGTLLGA
ncbi:MAG: UDP-N-acetylmuramate dehydrogenase [Polyangiaceae bacterium]|nr:UDP-N-acetylmuramate dehydrogenase [Polyangiaceae bacterium]